jgi:hypothetical protein
MAKVPFYAILGRGRWASRMHGILARERRRTISLEQTRRGPAESESDYKSRLRDALTATGTHIAWLCLAPGPHIRLIVEAAVSAGVHVVVEKPWLCSRAETDSLLALSRAAGCLVAIHYEYCLLEGVEAWRRDLHQRADLSFRGRFLLRRPDHSGIPAIDNLGAHLLAIRAYAVPRSALAEIQCGYELPDERRVSVEKSGENVASIDFLANKEPIIQRFIARLEAALDGADFPFDLGLADRVADEVASLKGKT